MVQLRAKFAQLHHAAKAAAGCEPQSVLRLENAFSEQFQQLSFVRV